MSLGSILTLAITPVALSAERIFFNRLSRHLGGGFEDLAEDGTVNERFHPFASRLNEQQFQELQTFLNWRLDVDLIAPCLN